MDAMQSSLIIGKFPSSYTQRHIVMAVIASVEITSIFKKGTWQPRFKIFVGISSYNVVAITNTTEGGKNEKGE